MISFYELQSIAGLIGIYAILSMSLNLLCGTMGVLQLGHAGFFAAGAYAAALTSVWLTIPEIGWLNFFISAAAAMSCAGVFSLLLGVPCLRLRGDYLAVATLGFGEIIRLSLTNLTFPGGRMFPGETIGGSTGISFTENPAALWPRYPDYSANYAKWWVIWIFAALVWLILINIRRSSYGRAMLCARDDETAASSMGISPAKLKIFVFLTSAAFAGLAGALFFHRDLMIAPCNFTLFCGIEILLMAILGGLGSVTGSIAGAVMLGLTPFLLRHIGLGEYCNIIYSVILILLMRLFPGGIFGSSEFPPFLRNIKKEERRSIKSAT
jgi:branched-chain amino acid transport system permease protein